MTYAAGGGILTFVLGAAASAAQEGAGLSAGEYAGFGIEILSVQFVLLALFALFVNTFVLVGATDFMQRRVGISAWLLAWMTGCSAIFAAIGGFDAGAFVSNLFLCLLFVKLRGDTRTLAPFKRPYLLTCFAAGIALAIGVAIGYAGGIRTF